MNAIKNVILAAVLIGFFVMPTQSNAHTRVVVKVRPPALRVDVRPAHRHAGRIWIAGHWRWHHGRYVWVTGRWVRPQPGRVWVAGYWRRVPRGWVWVPGRWRHVR